MLKHLSLAAILLASAAPMAAHAQDAGDDDTDRYERSADREDGPSPGPERRDERDGDDRMRDMRHGDRWARNAEADRDGPRRPDMERDDRSGPRGPHGPDGRRGPPPPPKAGFEIRLGEGRAIRVDCGDERIAECVDAAQPVIDAMARLPGMEAGDRVPPPPRSLVEGDMPPPAGDVAPPAGAGTPPPPAAPGPAN